ncbi:nucleoside 2-deoxyribosyltransferase [Vibrio vulnificus]|uniref:nucleoside 2-deoxyribosyltransferase n=1 Tax=Vibrio vulnificus TaxID=672 RepID=UPI0010293125|nr:nucleoside 2-deoxyribosyltransferase [Vibrio vulnificus]RZP61091.1 nucleoside 2-deoxyribosyltransferase [Vibrio vulnificus]
MKVYLAGPEVFLKNAVEMGKTKKKLCEILGFEGVFPLDNELELNAASPQENGINIAKANEELIKDCDFVIANMTPFRSASCDVGTAYEMGFAKGLGKPVFAYTNDRALFLERNLKQLTKTSKVSEQHYVDNLDMTIENFGLIDNLMLDNAVVSSISVAHAEPHEKYTDLVSFEKALKAAKEYFNC